MAGNTTTHADTYRREALLTCRMWEEIYMARQFEKTNRKDKLNVEDNQDYYMSSFDSQIYISD